MARVSVLFIYLVSTQLSTLCINGSCLVTYGDRKRCSPSHRTRLGYCPVLASRMVAKNETGRNHDELPEDLGWRERKKRQRQQDYEHRRKLWLDRYGSADALRSTFGSGPPWGDLSPKETRAFYHTLLPRSLLALSEMGLMKPEELAPLAYAARIAAKEYARSRCIWTGRIATSLFDQYRSLRDKGRFLGPGSSSSMSWEEVWEKYEAQIVEEECADVIDGSRKKRRRRNKELDEETLTMRIYMRILEKSCETNQAFDSMFLSKDRDVNSNLVAIASKLEEDIKFILLSPKENSKREKKIGKINKQLEKEKKREKKRQREDEKKEEKKPKRQEKLERKMETDEGDSEQDEKKYNKTSRKRAKIDAEENDDEDSPAKEYSKRSEALRILSITRRQFRDLFPQKKDG